MEKYGAAGIELNLSCPHAKGLGMEIGSDPKMIRSIVRAVVKKVEIPVFAKLTPQTPDIIALGRAAAESGAAGLVAINTIKAMKIDISTAMPVLGNRIGGYSGPAVKPVGVRAVYELSSDLDIPVIGVGGITTGEDVAEYMMAGAAAVQIGSAVMYNGVDAFDRIHRELRMFMESSGYTDVKKLIGAAIRSQDD
jgi:dihydroorotate dehydrogenase (NAD+) catalytic subunit